MLLIILILCQQKKNIIENFKNDEFINNIYGVRYDEEEASITEPCKGTGEDTVILEAKKNKMIYPKLCTTKNKVGLNEKAEFINYIEESSSSNLRQDESVVNEANKADYIRSGSDYLGCYQWRNPTDNTEYVTGLNPLENTLDLKTVSEKKNTSADDSLMYFSSDIDSRLTSVGENKALTGNITTSQFNQLLGYDSDGNNYTQSNNRRVPDKYCLGRGEFKSGKVVNYLGGVGTVAIYKKGEPEIKKPPLFIRDLAIETSSECTSTNITLDCIIKFKKHVLAHYSLNNDTWSTAVDTNDEGIESITSDNLSEYTVPSEVANNNYKNSGTGRVVMIDTSGHENHLIHDYNYLNFVGTYDFLSLWGEKCQINNYYKNFLQKDFSTASLQDVDLTSNENKYIFTRCKDKETVDKSKYCFINNDGKINNKDFSEVNNSFIKKDTYVMRGKHNIWPYLGMIPFNNDNNNYKSTGDCNQNIQSTNSLVEYNSTEGNCSYKLNYGKNSGDYMRLKIPNYKSAYNFKTDKNEYPHSRTFGQLEDLRVEKHNTDHRCFCYGDDAAQDCFHIRCLNKSYLNHVNWYHNPNPLYVGVSQILNKDNLKQYQGNSERKLNLVTKKIDLKSNKFFFRSLNNITTQLKNQYMFYFKFS